MLWQPIHFAPGATPISLLPPLSLSSPTVVPVVCVPWPLSSHGCIELNPHGFVPSPSMSLWIESCQL